MMSSDDYPWNQIEVGTRVRNYRNPSGTHYIEGVVQEIKNGCYWIRIDRRVFYKHEKRVTWESVICVPTNGLSKKVMTWKI